MRRSIIILFLSCLFLISSCTANKSKLKIKKENNISSQNIQHRQWFLKAKEIGKLNIRNKVFQPFLSAASDTFLFILDYSSMKIHIFSPYDNSFHSVIGNGKGHGPGELINPTKMTLYKQNIYISDPIKGSIEIYNIKNGLLIESIKVGENIIPKNIMVGDDKIVIQNQYNINSDNLISFTHTFEENGKRFGKNLVNINLGNSIYHESNYCIVNNNIIVQSTLRSGLIGKYFNEELVLVKETIDGIQLDPIGIIEKNNKISTDKNIFILTSQVLICDGEKIINLVYKKDNKVKEKIFDLYDIESLAYIASFRVDKDVFQFQIINDIFITINSDEICFWEIERTRDEKI